MTDLPQIQAQRESFVFVPKLQEFLQRVLEAEVKQMRKSFTKILNIYRGHWQNSLANYWLLGRLIINTSYPLVERFSKLFFWHLTLIIFDMKMPNLSEIIPVGELKIDIVPSPLTTMNYSVCFQLSTSRSDFQHCSFVHKWLAAPLLNNFKMIGSGQVVWSIDVLEMMSTEKCSSRLMESSVSS